MSADLQLEIAVGRLLVSCSTEDKASVSGAAATLAHEGHVVCRSAAASSATGVSDTRGRFELLGTIEGNLCDLWNGDAKA